MGSTVPLSFRNVSYATLARPLHEVREMRTQPVKRVESQNSGRREAPAHEPSAQTSTEVIPFVEPEPHWSDVIDSATD